MDQTQGQNIHNDEGIHHDEGIHNNEDLRNAAVASIVTQQVESAGDTHEDSPATSTAEPVSPILSTSKQDHTESGSSAAHLSPSLTKTGTFNIREIASGSSSQAQPHHAEKPTSTDCDFDDEKGNGPRPPAGPTQKHKGNPIICVFKNWPLEILASLLMLLLLIAEIILLAHYDKKPISIWPHDWKINSVFAFLTTLMEASMTFCVLACIGQLRWLWFEKKPDALMWMDRLTKMHSAPGAVMFLATKGSFKRFATLGALIMVAILGLSTFVQNVIVQRAQSTIVVPHNSDSAAAKISTEYAWISQGTTGLENGDQHPIAPLIGAIESGFYVPGSFDEVDSADSNVHCETGNCTFGSYQSLAVCNQCANITDKVNAPNEDGYYTLSEDYNLDLSINGAFINSNSTPEYPFSSELPHSGPLIGTFQAIAAANSTQAGQGAVAAECAIYWCVQTYTGTMDNGIMTEIVTKEWTNTTMHTYWHDTHEIILTPATCLRDNKSQPTGSDDCTFRVSARAHIAIQNFLLGYRDSNETLLIPAFLHGSVYKHHNKDNNSTGWVVSTESASSLYWAATSPQSVNQTFSSVIPMAIGNMTLYMTNSIRRTQGNPGRAQYSYGAAYLYESYFHVRWGWMAYPISLVFFSLVFLVVTLIKCEKSQAYLWKTSVIAMMFHPFSNDEIDQFLSLGTLDKMQDAMHRHKVRLVNHRFMPFGSSDYPEGLNEEVVHGATNVGKATIEPLNAMVVVDQ